MDGLGERQVNWRQRRGWWTALALIAAAALAVRIVYWAQYVTLPPGQVAVGADVMAYDRWARRILAGQWLWDQIPIHAPLYAYWLAGVYACTGVSVPAARLLQLGLDLLSLTLVALALWRLVNARTALICAGLWALYLPLVSYSGELLCEGLAVALLAGILACWAWSFGPGGRGRRRWWPLVLSAFLAGLAAITHPLTLGLTLPYLAWCLLELRPGRPRAVWGRLAALVGALFLLPILAVTLRHRALSGDWVLIQANAGLNLYIGNHRGATGTCYLRPGAAYDEVVSRAVGAGATGEAAAQRYFRAEVRRFVASHPGQAARLVVRKALLTWNAVDLTSGSDLPLMQHLTPLMRAPLLRFGFVGPLALIVWVSFRGRRRLVPFLWAPVAGTLTLALLVTSGRYRLLAAPAVLASAALACEGLWRAWRRGDQRTWALGVVVALGGLALAHGVPVPPLPSAEFEAVALLAEAAWRVGDARQAEAVARYGLGLRADDPGLTQLLGNALLAQGRGEAGRAALRAAASAPQPPPTAAADLAIALAEAGQDDEALAWLTRAATPPAPASVWYNLGVLHERRGDTGAALAAYRQACRRDPAEASAWLNLGLLLVRAGIPEAAPAALATALRLRPHDDKAMAGLAAYHAGRGDDQAAAHWFERALAANPGRDDLRAAYRDLQERRPAAPPPAQETPP